MTHGALEGALPLVGAWVFALHGGVPSLGVCNACAGPLRPLGRARRPRPTVFSCEEHGNRGLQGLRWVVQQGAALVGLRPATERNSATVHGAALQRVLEDRDVQEAGPGKSLSALGRDLFEAGFRTGSGKPMTLRWSGG